MSNIDFNNWIFYKKGIISRVPPYREITVDKKALFNHFKGAFYIRWDSDFDNTDNPNYYHVIKDSGCAIESLPPKTRNQIRRCLENCEIKRVNFQFIVDNGGYEVYASEYRRYEKNGHASVAKPKKQWAEGMEEAARRGQEFWAVICDNKVIAYSICWRKEAHIDLVTWKVDYENYNQLYPSYGLVYSMCDYYLAQEGVRYVDDGGRSLTEHSGVQDFLIEKFCFRKVNTKLNAEFKWYLSIVLRLLSPFENQIKNNQIFSLIRLYKWSRCN